MNQFRDAGIDLIKARRGHSCYGMGLGIIILDEVYPGFPGDVRNASAYPFPIQYEIVKDVDINALCRTEDKTPCLEPIKQAALNLEKLGCRAISAECGYFAYFQKEIASCVNIPVYMSSLLQVPIAQRTIAPDKIVGLLVGDKTLLRNEHLIAVGVDPDSNYVVETGTTEEMRQLWHDDERKELPEASYVKASKEFVERAVGFFERNPNMGAMVMECTGFPPFAREVQRIIDIPIYSYATLLDYAYSITTHRDFYGYV